MDSCWQAGIVCMRVCVLICIHTVCVCTCIKTSCCVTTGVKSCPLMQRSIYIPTIPQRIMRACRRVYGKVRDYTGQMQSYNFSSTLFVSSFCLDYIFHLLSLSASDNLKWIVLSQSHTYWSIVTKTSLPPSPGAGLLLEPPAVSSSPPGCLSGLSSQSTPPLYRLRHTRIHTYTDSDTFCKYQHICPQRKEPYFLWDFT